MNLRGLLLLILALTACSDRGSGDAPLLVFAAASTVDTMSEITRRYEADGHGRVVCSFAASSTLARQIMAGAEADVFLSADAAWMDELERRDALVPGSRSDLLGNTLVWVAPRERPFTVDLGPGGEVAAIPGRIALADPEHVPAGRYAAAALRRLGWWDQLHDRLVPAVDVRAALRMVELGAVESGIVYATDAAVSDGVEIIAWFDEDVHAPIRYPIASLAGRRARAEPFVAYLHGPEAARIFSDAGFNTSELPARR